MAIEASFSVERADFPLSAVFEQLSDATIEVDRVVPTGGTVVPYFCISADDTNRLATDLNADIGIDEVKVIDRVEEQTFVRIGSRHSRRDRAWRGPTGLGSTTVEYRHGRTRSTGHGVGYRASGL